MASNALKNVIQLRPEDDGMNIEGRLKLTDIIESTVDHTPLRHWTYVSGTNYSQSDNQYETPTYSITPTQTENLRLSIVGFVNARFLENSDDPGIRMYLQYYNSANSWATLGDTDNYFIGRWADRGSSNYLRSELSSSAELNVTASQLNGGQVKLRQIIIGHGGTSGDDLDVYNHGYRITEKAYW